MAGYPCSLRLVAALLSRGGWAAAAVEQGCNSIKILRELQHLFNA